MLYSRPLYFVQEHLGQQVFNGAIGNVDIEKILLTRMAIPILFPCQFDFSFKAKILRSLYLGKLLFSIKNGSIVFFQYPLYASMHKIFLRLLRLKRNIHIICFIADINGLKQGNRLLLKKEISYFRGHTYFILHNRAMQNWLQKIVPRNKSALISFFDFLTTSRVHKRIKSLTIVFAGNLSKSLFLEKLNPLYQIFPEVIFNIYGPGITPAMQVQKNTRYYGVIDPYDLPGRLEGSFGLVWDGESIGSPSGSLGEYMHYISHHKLSLYILSNLPVIIFEDAGSAQLVVKHNIGFTIKNLFEMEQKINALSKEEYAEMSKNTIALAERISSGSCLQEALDEILEMIYRENAGK